MRISFMGSTPFPVSQEQSGTCMLVELGNGSPQPRRFFFDLGGGSIFDRFFRHRRAGPLPAGEISASRQHPVARLQCDRSLRRCQRQPL